MVDITFKLGFNGCISICHYVHDIADITSLGCLVHQCLMFLVRGIPESCMAVAINSDYLI